MGKVLAPADSVTTRSLYFTENTAWPLPHQPILLWNKPHFIPKHGSKCPTRWEHPRMLAHTHVTSYSIENINEDSIASSSWCSSFSNCLIRHFFNLFKSGSKSGPKTAVDGEESWDACDQGQGWQTLSIKGWALSTLGVKGQTVSVAMI